MAILGPRRRPTLKELCLRVLSDANSGSICFQGVPPHLVNQILSNVKSPEELRRVQDKKENQDIVGFDKALEERWRSFCIEKYPGRRPDSDSLPPDWSWRDFYDSLEFERKKAFEQHAKRIDKEKEEKKPKKQVKVLDISEVPEARHNYPSHVKSSGYTHTPKMKPAPGSLAEDFFRKHRMHFH